jgi:DNA (cytosine-5)-methyltransferase 1
MIKSRGKMKKGLNVLDLFCGAGGLSEGFRQAGFNVVMGIDHNETALKTFMKNHLGSEIIRGDIAKITKKDISNRISGKKIDVIIGGPPCQGFSMAGKRIPNDPRNSLFREYLRLVKEIRPKVFVMENVRGLLSMKNGNGQKVIDIILGEFRKIKGYSTVMYPVNAADYGVPQIRQRIFVIGIKKYCKFNFPSPIYPKKKWVSVKNLLINRDKIDKKYFYSDKLIKGFKRREKENKKRKLGFGWQFINPDKPSYTISARYWKDGAEALVKYSSKRIRRLTPKECAFIQSFPQKYHFEGNEREVYQQIGNAVPPKLALNIANAIKNTLI